MTSIVKTMAAPESGLDIRDRMWLKITIPNAFIGNCKGKGGMGRKFGNKPQEKKCAAAINVTLLTVLT